MRDAAVFLFRFFFFDVLLPLRYAIMMTPACCFAATLIDDATLFRFSPCFDFLRCRYFDAYFATKPGDKDILKSLLLLFLRHADIMRISNTIRSMARTFTISTTVNDVRRT